MHKEKNSKRASLIFQKQKQKTENQTKQTRNAQNTKSKPTNSNARNNNKHLGQLNMLTLDL